MPQSGFTEPQLLWGITLILPLILLYLLKPKPKTIRIPSTMFIERMEKTRRLRSLLKKFIKDPLLLLQIIIIIALISAGANPFSIAKERKTNDEAAVFILDSSASMRSTDAKPNRFEVARENALSILSGLDEKSTVYVVLAGNIPILLSGKGDTAEAESILKQVSSVDTMSNLGDALLLSKDLISGATKPRKIYVLSDFSWTDGADLLSAKRIASDMNISVYFTKAGGVWSNVGLTSFDARRSVKDKNKVVVSFTLTNFASERKDVNLAVKVDGRIVNSTKKEMSPLSDDVFYLLVDVSESKHTLTVDLKDDDSLDVDDTAYWMIPELRKYSVLLVTSGSDDGDVYLKLALDSSESITLAETVPPVMPPLKEFDAVILGHVKNDMLLPGTFKMLRDYVNDGGSLIVLPSEDLVGNNDPYLWDILPINITGGLVDVESSIEKESNHEILRDVFFKNIIVKRFINAEPKKESIVIAKTSSTPLLSYWKYGKGMVSYAGISPSKSWSNFYYSTSFPILWTQLIGYVNQKDGESLRKLNFNTGESITLQNGSTITTPSGKKLESSNLILDRVGIYEIKNQGGNRKIAVNLLNRWESNLTTLIPESELSPVRTREDTFDAIRNYRNYLLALAILLLVFEIGYYHKRGLI